MSITSFYFDGSDMSATDIDGAWNNETNSDDGNTGTYATCTTPVAFTGEPSNYAIVIFGTSASGSEVITGVRVRIHNGTDWGSYVTVSAPSGGWSWSELQALKCFTQYGNVEGTVATYIYEEGDWEGTILACASVDPVSGEGRISKIEIEVTHGVHVNIKAGNGSVGSSYLSQTYVSGTPSLGQIFSELFEDAISLVDSKILKPIKTFTESLGLTEVFSKFTSKVAFIENIILSEVFNIKKVFLIVLQDAITLAESFATVLHKFFSEIFADTVAFIDSGSRVLDKLMEFVDNILTTDTDSYKKSIKGFIDSIGLSDTGSIAQVIGRIFTDTIALADSTVKSIGKAFSDAVSFVDTKIVSVVRSYIESINLSESITKSVNILVTDTIGLVESIIRRLNGMILNWDKRAKAITDWTKRVRQEVSTTKIARAVNDWTKRSKNEETFTKTSKEEKDWTKLKGINDND